MKKMLKVTLISLFFGGLFADSWELSSVFKAYDSPRNNGYGIHGTVVAPDGNIWVAIQGGMAGDSLAHTFTALDGTDSAGFVHTRPIHVFTPEGEHTSYSPIRYVGSSDAGNLDTLVQDGLGMCLDHDGNILYTTSSLYRFNYMTGEMMHHTVVPYDEAGSTTKLTQPSIDQNGNIYVGWVAGADKPIVKISPDFLTQTTVVANGINYNRSALVSPDASYMYLGSTWNGVGVTVLRANTLGTAFTEVDTTMGNVMGAVLDSLGNTVLSADGTDSMETKHLWAEALFWNHDILWVGETDPAWSNHPLAGSWVGINPYTGEIVDTIGVGTSVTPEMDGAGLAATGVTCNPRTMGRSPDGLTLYIGDFSTNVIQVWTNPNPTVSVIEDDTDAPIVAKGFKLHQAYPNPFNPSTKIDYEIGSIGNAKLEIFNLKGELVNTLANGWHNLGTHQVLWNGKDARGMQVTSGTYIYRLTSADVSFSKTVTLIK